MALPSLRLSDVPPGGFRFSCTVQPDEIPLGLTDARIAEALSVVADVERSDATLRLRGAVTGAFVRECVRCLKEYRCPVRIPLRVEYRPDAYKASALASRVTRDSEPDCPQHCPQEEDDDYDVYEYAGETVELGGMLREQIILATPMRALCQEDCLGLCPVCGHDRNERRCGCPEQQGRSPFAVLSAWRDGGPGRPSRRKPDPSAH